MMPEVPARTEFRTPRWMRLFSLFGVVVLGGVSAGLTILAVVLLVSTRLSVVTFVVAAVACFLAALTGYVARDLRGKWGLRVVLERDALMLDLPGGRSLIHRPPALYARIPYPEIAAIETRLEAFGTLGMEMMQRAYVLRRNTADRTADKIGELIFLFEDRALATPYTDEMFPKLAADIAARANVPLRDLGMVEGKGGVLGVWGTEAPDWATPSLPLRRQLQLWRHAAFTGTLSLVVIIAALVIRLLSGPL
jgi:hypothetical protein